MSTTTTTTTTTTDATAPARRFGFELYDAEARRWSAEACGEQNDSNYLETEAEAIAELPRLARVLGCDVSELRVTATRAARREGHHEQP